MIFLKKLKNVTRSTCNLVYSKFECFSFQNFDAKLHCFSRFSYAICLMSNVKCEWSWHCFILTGDGYFPISFCQIQSPLLWCLKLLILCHIEANNVVLIRVSNSNRKKQATSLHRWFIHWQNSLYSLNYSITKMFSS